MGELSSWIYSYLFAAGREARKKEKERVKQEAFLREQRVQLRGMFVKLQDEIIELSDACGPIGIPQSFAQDMKLAPLFAIGQVLSVQGMIYPEQETELKLFLSNVVPAYNYAQFTQAVIHRTGVYSEYWETVGLDDRTFGSLWRTIFEMIYRSRRVEASQTLVDCLSFIVIHFSALGDSGVPYAKPICDRILSSMNRYANEYQQTPYIHGLLLLQQELLALSHLEIEEHFFLRKDDLHKETRTFYVFDVYRKTDMEHCGRFAVRALHTKADGMLDFTDDKDLILIWNPAAGAYEKYYEDP